MITIGLSIWIILLIIFVIGEYAYALLAGLSVGVLVLVMAQIKTWWTHREFKKLEKKINNK